MKLKKINGTHLYHAFLSGARQIIKQKSELNRINVFPVADGDTGSNMAAMMQRIITDAEISPHLGIVLESISAAAIAGSRGNSGIIFSEYLNGIYESLKEEQEATVQRFHAAVLNGIKKAYEAILNPVEGTILTVFRKAFEVRTTIDDFFLYFATIKAQSLVALIETTEELAILKLNHVVDAGAQGLTAFIDGVNYYFVNGIEMNGVEIEEEEETVHSQGVHEEQLTERYCTEALLINVKITPQEMKALLAPAGSSLVVSGRSEKMRIHIHTNNPELVFIKLREQGEIIEQKVDDMLRQNQAMQSDHPRVAIVTDTIADIPQALLDQYQIHLIPMYLIVDDVSYLDKLTITTNTFYKMLDHSKTFSSSQPDKLTIERNLSFLLEHYDDVIVITVASRLSGTYNAMIQFAKNHQKIHVVDSKQNSGAQGLVVLKAAELAWQDKSAAEIIDFINDFSKQTKIYVSVKTLKYMVKLGRVSKVVGLIGKIVNLKPVIGLSSDGAGIIRAKSFSLTGNIRQIMKLLKAAPVENYAIVHSLALKRAEKFAKKVEALTGKKPQYIELISPIVAMNAGIGAIAIAVTFTKEVA
ncbi:MAG: DegV family protein [Bacilli bacterium]|jgi:DegV family protein with EDD domain|nr:DegV family protein [Bacilli bacterium]